MKDKNPGGRPTTKDKPAMLLYRILDPNVDGEPKWQVIKGEGSKTVTLNANKSIAKDKLISVLEKEEIQFPVEYKVLLVMEHKIMAPVTTTKFVEEHIPDDELPESEEDNQPPEDIEPGTENDLHNEEPVIGD